MSVLPTPASLRRGLATYLRHYHRHEVHLDSPIPDEPVLFVCNHGFGGVVDLNALALLHTVHRHVPSRPRHLPGPPGRVDPAGGPGH
jgi:1-acyl-sn-glycerol-3-phosphate acyltransferase